MNSLHSLITHLKQKGVLSSDKIIQAFEAVDRKYFVTHKFQEYAYIDEALSIGEEQTISQPSVVAFMLELLDPHKGQKILDVGSGSGYTTALLAHIVGPSGYVYGTERIPNLVTFGKNNIAKIPILNATVIETPTTIGLQQEAPFDRILVSAAADELPQALLEQLSVGGKIVVPIKNEIQKIEKRADGVTQIEKYPGFIFVPLIVKQ